MKTLSTPAPKLVWGQKTLPLLLIFVFLTAAAAEKIDINAASLEELQKLIGVGPVIAQRIIDARPFYSVDELIRVNGIGEKKLANIKTQGLAWVDSNLTLPAPQPIVKQQPLPPAPIEQGSLQPKESTSVRIDINSASASELQKLTGIGQALAQRIIDARPFYSVDDLTKVQGVGEKTLRDIKTQGLAWVDPALTPPQARRDVELTEKGLAAAAQPVRGASPAQNTGKPLPVFFIALTLAFSSGAAVFILKKKVEKAYSPD